MKYIKFDYNWFEKQFNHIKKPDFKPIFSKNRSFDFMDTFFLDEEISAAESYLRFLKDHYEVLRIYQLQKYAAELANVEFNKKLRNQVKAKR